MFSLRKFHNEIKNNYLTKYITHKNTRLLDLASGKGGDLHKWIKNDFITQVDGYEIDQNSINEANRRRDKIKPNKSINFYNVDLSKGILNCKSKYNVITVHFALHYFFKNSSSLRNILSSIENCSKKGSILMITLMNGNKVEEIFSDNFYIKYLPSYFGSKTNYGKGIEVYIKDAVLNEPREEYIVKPDFLINKLKLIGFKLIERKSFEELYNNTRLKLTEEEKKFSFFNEIFIFKKE